MQTHLPLKSSSGQQIPQNLLMVTLTRKLAFALKRQEGRQLDAIAVMQSAQRQSLDKFPSGHLFFESRLCSQLVTVCTDLVLGARFPQGNPTERKHSEYILREG